MASRDPLIEPYRPHESASTHEFDYEYDFDSEPEEEPGGRGRVLWGRVAAFGGALLLAFLVGRASAPGGIPEEELRAARTEARAAEEEADQLRDELAAAQAETEQPAEEPTGGGGGKKQADPEPENEIYVVQSGDTLTTIAEKEYGDASLDDFLAEANPGIDPLALRVGQEIVIPPKPEE
ncbi:MAG TPA: LysM domain-containing protein [Actinomycetota bacterium]|nr:LysM domain-containing protein [Actinomycetota bacterium]